MRATPVLASLLLVTPLALSAAPAGKAGSSAVQKRYDEYERQIRDLEEQNSHLKVLLAEAGKTTGGSPEAAKKDEKKPEAKPEDTDRSNNGNAPLKVTVRDGDTWVKLAKRNGTTAESLAKANRMKPTSALREGQVLTLPGEETKTLASAETKASPGATHVVKEGETFYSIGKRYGLGAEMIQDANPGVKATSLREGMVLKLGAKTLVAKTDKEALKRDAGKKEPASTKNDSGSDKMPRGIARKEASPAPKISKPENPPESESAAGQKMAAAADRKQDAPAPASGPADLAPAGDNGSETMVSAPKMKVRNMKLDEEISFGSFAQAHGTTPEKLNALNGLNLNSSTVLARGSELRVPAQP